METHRSNRFASGVAAIAGRKRARYRHSAYCAAVENGLRSYTMSGRLMRLRGNGTRRTEQEEERERERKRDNTERGVSAGVQIYAGATLM